MGTGTKEDESSTGCIWAAEFQHVAARSSLAHFETYEPFTSLIFLFFGGHGKPQILNQWIQGLYCEISVLFYCNTCIFIMTSTVARY
jgi:hypothetical protein